MSGYDRKIIYLSEMQNGSRVGGAGFLKLESRPDRCLLDMHVSGIADVPDQYYTVLAEYSAEGVCPVGRIFLRTGKGQWKESLDTDREENSLAAGMPRRLRIELDDSRWVGAVLKESPVSEREESQEREPEEKERKSKKTSESRSEPLLRKIIKAAPAPARPVPARPVQAAPEEPAGKEAAELKAGSLEEESRSDRRMPKKPEAEQVILSDKWQQLKRIYPTVHPYEDEREYISICPRDFVIMTGDFQHLANNSFLLHGYYNYRYLILGKERTPESGTEGGDNGENGEESFYLGVPGVYYEREKMVALMFGFEAFECAGGNAEPGTFGYYLRKVRI